MDIGTGLSSQLFFKKRMIEEIRLVNRSGQCTCPHVPGSNEPERVEYGISVAATILEYAFKNVIEAGFGSNAFLKDMEKRPIRISPTTGSQHRITILENLARMVILRSVSFPTLLEQELERNPGNTDYLLITAVVDRDIEDRIRRLRAMGNAVEILKI